jgi:ribonuclease HI
MQLTLWFDGACEPRNPGGTGTWGYVIQGLGDDVEGCGALKACPEMTNNFAEYTAFGKGLRYLVDNCTDLKADDELIIHGDSKLVICQLTGQWAIRAENLKPLANRR